MTVPALAAQTPRFGNAVTRAIGLAGLRLIGWKVVGEVPNVPRAIFSAAPHTSNWDFIIAMLAIMSMGVKISYLMKKEAFFWPFKRAFIALGGIPIDRTATTDTVSQIANWLKKSDKMWVAITPEGTRRRVDKWKTGFLRVAEQADVPIVLVAWDYPTRTLVVDKLCYPSGDHESDAVAIRSYINQRYKGRHPEKQ